MGQSESREPKIQPEGSAAQRDGFTTQETKDYCKKIQDEVNKDMPYI